MLHVKPGELVDILLKDVEVVTAGSPSLEVLYRAGAKREAYALYINPDSPNLVVTRVAPAEWPPQIGDVWADSHGGEWWCRPEYDGADAEAYLQSQKGGVDDPAWVLRQYGPMTLVYRKGWTAADVDEADEAKPEVLDGLSRHQRVVAGLRQLADFLESSPELPLPDWDGALSFDTGANWPGSGEAEEIGRVRRWAEILDVDVDSSTSSSGKTHWRAYRTFGGVRIGIVTITETPADVPPPPEVAGPGPAATEPEPATTEPATTEPGPEDVAVGDYWCTVNGGRCEAETDPCHLCPTAAEPVPAPAEEA